MGRRSLEAERTRQMLDAFIQCIPESGIDGTSLEKVAEKAGVTRGLIRHHVGNRDAFLEKLVDRLIETSLAEFESELGAPGRSLRERLSSLLLAPRTDHPLDRVVLNELITARDQAPAVRAKVAALIETMLDRLSAELYRANPSREPAEGARMAYALFGLAFAQDSLAWLRVDPTHLSLGPTIVRQMIDDWERLPAR